LEISEGVSRRFLARVVSSGWLVLIHGLAAVLCFLLRNKKTVIVLYCTVLYCTVLYCDDKCCGASWRQRLKRNNHSIMCQYYKSNGGGDEGECGIIGWRGRGCHVKQEP